MGRDFQARYGFKPVNHLVVVKSELAQEAGLVDELLAMFGPSTTTRDALAPAIALSNRFCVAQGLTSRALSMDEVWS